MNKYVYRMSVTFYLKKCGETKQAVTECYYEVIKKGISEED